MYYHSTITVEAVDVFANIVRNILNKKSMTIKFLIEFI
ncbi:conserved hypothetical protein [Streptococcus infantis SK1302]|uniref:Uncharacterized protein n=1 Tax=Streptococcus infantis SK1302 TaxID=871237 RepID=A0ABP2J1L6_9STRE|nr:conserved hypothetical protein [Streptococcus infantis SK1302]